MARQKGQQKVGGRKKGTPNKITADVRQRIKDFVDGNFDSVPDWIKKVATKDPAKAAQLFIELLKFIIPHAKQELDITTNGESLRETIAQKFDEMFTANDKADQ